MILSQESEYGLRGLIVLAGEPHGKIMLLQEIADTGRLPRDFLARIFQKLRRHALVLSHRGAVRGYRLARPANRIRLREIFEAIEGPEFFTGCIFRPRVCDLREPCGLHEAWLPARTRLRREMEHTTLAAVASLETRGSRAGRRKRSRRRP